MESSCQPTLKVVRSLLQGRNGADAALSLLERRTQEQSTLYNSPVVWACLSDLRARTGDSNGAVNAAQRASLLRTAPVRSLSFSDADCLPDNPPVSCTVSTPSTPSPRPRPRSRPSASLTSVVCVARAHEMPTRDLAKTARFTAQASGRVKMAVRRRELREQCRNLLIEGGADPDAHRFGRVRDGLSAREHFLLHRLKFLKQRTAALLQVDVRDSD